MKTINPKRTVVISCIISFALPLIYTYIIGFLNTHPLALLFYMALGFSVFDTISAIFLIAQIVRLKKNRILLSTSTRSIIALLLFLDIGFVSYVIMFFIGIFLLQIGGFYANYLGIGAAILISIFTVIPLIRTIPRQPKTNLGQS